MNFKQFIIILLTGFLVNPVFCQVSIKDSTIGLNSMSFNYSYLIPAADLAKRFGNSSYLSIHFLRKTKSNFFAEFSGGFFFSKNVKDTLILDNVNTSEGYMINNQGLLCPISIEQRGFNINLLAGYLFPIFGPNPNSGLTIGAGIGFLQHNLFFDYTYGPVYAIEKNYRKGYDRLTNGFGLIQKIGYQRFGDLGLGNYHVSFFVLEAFTQNRRDIDFYSRKKDDKNRLDVLFGINLGVDIPIYKRIANDFYFK